MSSLDGWDLDLEPVVKETYLSRKPAPKSAWVALGSMGVLLVASLIFWANLFDLATYLPASRAAVYFEGQYWRLLTSILVHADFQHFISNAVVLGVLAFLVFGYFGPTVYPGLTLALGGFVTALSLRTYPAHTQLVGASGVVYLLAGFWLTLYLLVERRLSVKVRLVRAVGFGLIVLVPTAIQPIVSYRTHTIGFLVGVAFAVVYFSRRKEELRRAERIQLE